MDARLAAATAQWEHAQDAVTRYMQSTFYEPIVLTFLLSRLDRARAELSRVRTAQRQHPTNCPCIGCDAVSCGDYSYPVTLNPAP